MTTRFHTDSGASHPPSQPGICPSCGTLLSSNPLTSANVCQGCSFDATAGNAPDALPASPLIEDGPSAGTCVWGSYTLLEEIGRGGMGIIYRAMHRQTGEIFAIKTIFLRDSDCQETIARFEREAMAATSLNHPHAMPIYEVGRSPDGRPFFSMKLAAGGGLHQLFEKYRGCWREIAELMIKITAAIQHAHDAGILHRDLKPGNILFDENDEPMITDFGLAKWFTGSENLTQSCAVLGTPNYVAPEQAQGQTRSLTAATDIYSLGAIFFELLTGRPPFAGDNPLDVIRQAAECKPLRPRLLAPGIPRTLERICLRCLERRAEDRYRRASEFSEDLHRWLQGKRVPSRPIRWRNWRQIARRGAVGMGVGCVFVWTISAWFKPWLLDRSNLPPSIPHVAVLIDDLDQGADVHTLTTRLEEEFKRQFSQGGSLLLSQSENLTGEHLVGLDDLAGYGRAINAQGVLSATVRRSVGQIKLVARLVRSDNGETVWQHGELLPVDRFITELPTVASALLHDLGAVLKKRPNLLTEAPFRLQADAAAFFAKGKELAGRPTQTDLREGITLLDKVVQLEPSFLPARSMLAQCYARQEYIWDDPGKLGLAESTAKEILRQSPDCSDAHRVLGCCAYKHSHYPEALEEFWNALEACPQSAVCNFWVGACLRELGRPDLATPWLKRAVRLDPSHGWSYGSLGETLMLAGDDVEAEALFQKGLELDPDHADTLMASAILCLWQQRFEQARQLCADAQRRFPDYRRKGEVVALIDFFGQESAQAQIGYEQLRAVGSYRQGWEAYSAVNPASALAWLAKQRGEPEQARSLAEEAINLDHDLLQKFPRNSRLLHDLAATYSLLGDTAQAMTHLREAISAGWVEHRSTLLDPRFSPLKSHPEFVALIKQTFPQPWREGDATLASSQPVASTLHGKPK